MTYRVCILAVVSDPRQAADDKASLDQQEADARAVCQARGWTVAHVICIPGQSRNYNWLHELVRDSPGYGEMVRLIESETIDLLVVRDYDRLWRTDALRAQLMALCREHHVQAFSMNQPVEPVAPEFMAESDTARLSEVLFGWVSEQENRTRVRRSRMGMQARARRGLYSGPRPPYGYDLDPTTGLRPDSAEAPWVLWMFERRAEGWGYVKIMNELERRGVPAPGGAAWYASTVGNILQNRVYVGDVHWGAVHGEGAHSSLVPVELFERVRTICETRSAWQFRELDARRPLVRLTTCGHCGWSCGYVYRTGRAPAIRCNQTGKVTGGCTVGQWPASWAEAEVLRQVQQALEDPVAWANSRESPGQLVDTQQQLDAIDAQLAEAQGRYARWDQLYESGGITANELLLHRQRLQGQAAQLRADRGRLEATREARAATLQRLDALRDLGRVLDQLSPAELRRVYATIIRRVTLYKPKALVIDWL